MRATWTGLWAGPVLGAIVLVTLAGCRDEELAGLVGGVAGQVCNPVTGRPAPGAKVTATFRREGGSKDESKEAESDDDGFFKIGGLPAGTASIEVVAAEFRSEKLEVDIIGREDVQLTDPACSDQPPAPGKGHIVGQVCNRHVGEFVTNGTVRVLLPDGSELSTNTDPETGIFRLQDVPAGVHVVYVQATGFQKTYQVEVKAGQTTELEEQVRDCEPPDPGTTGKIVGTICGAEVDGQPGAPLAGARVYVVQPIEGFIFEDETTPDGTFTIAGIPTPQAGLQVRAEKGGFAYQWDDVNVSAIAVAPDGTNLTASVGCQPLEPDDDRSYLVVNGTFDKIGNVLDRMGLNYTLAEGVPANVTTLWTSEVFANFDQLDNYDAVFVNCGVSEVDFDLGLSPAIAENLRRYVREGGSLYVSDWAYDLVEAVWPDKINFLRDDSENDGAEFGDDGTYTAQVTEPGLAQYLGASTVDISFSFGNFVVISDVAAGVTTYLRGDMRYRINQGTQTLTNAPITVGFSEGLGRVIFTTFHQETDLNGNSEVLDGPEDLVLRYLVFSL